MNFLFFPITRLLRFAYLRVKNEGRLGREKRKNACEINLKSSWRYTRIWYTLRLAEFDTWCQQYSVVDADKIYDMACKGHPPSSHARFESVLQQALTDFPHVDSLREEKIYCIEKKKSVSGKRCLRHSSLYWPRLNSRHPRNRPNVTYHEY